MPAGGNFTNCDCGPTSETCESPTQPLATVGLCLADGTPIAVTVVRDCAGMVTSEGWINLTTGAWSAGAPPAGTIACGDSRSITTTGTFCDVLEDGAVAGLVLVEYQYAADGSIAAVRLVDAVTGDTYVPAGEVTTCPAGVEQPERDLTQLCDLVDDESGAAPVSTPFLRDYARDENGQIVGHSDYTLDGAPYTPVGAVGGCQPQERCTDAYTQMLCDETVEVTWTQTSVVPDPAQPAGRGFIFTLSPTDDPDTVGTISVLVDRGNGSCGESYWPNGATFSYELDEVAQTMETLRVNLEDFDVAESITMLSGGAPDRLGGNAYVAAGGVIRSNANNAYGYMFFDSPPENLSYRFGGSCIGLNFNAVSRRTVQFLRKITTDCETGEVVSVTDTTLDGQPYTATGDIGDCSVGTGQCCPDSELLPLCDTAGDGTVTGFLRHLVYPQGGGTPTATDTALDGVTEYVPAGTVGICQPAEEACRDTSMLLLCDLPAGDPDGAATVTDTLASPYPWDTNPLRCVTDHPGGGGALWTGGSLTVPARTSAAGTCGTQQVLVGVAAALQAAAPACTDGTAEVTVTVSARNGGPSPSAPNYAGSLRLHRSDTGARVALATVELGGQAVGETRTMTATAMVPAALLEAGQVVAALDVETWDFSGNTGAAWTLSGFTATYTYGQDGCETQFLRTVVTDCETGAVVSTTDTTLDGDPYTVEGQAGQCAPTSSASDCTSCETLTLCDVQADESPGAPDITFEAIDLPTLADGPTSGTLSNGVGWTVSCGEWLAPQGHYTIYPAGGGGTPACDMVWTFDQPVYARVGLRGFNVGPSECLSWSSDTGAEFVVESLNPNHEISSTPNTICGLGTATDQSVIVSATPVAEVTLAAINNPGQGRGIGLMEVGLLNEPPAAGAVVSFLRTVCRDCSGAVISTTDTTLDGDPYTPTGAVSSCASAGSSTPVEPESCRDTSSTLLCDTAATDTITVFDPATRPDADDWSVISFTGSLADAPPEAPMPYPARYSTVHGYPALGARLDQSAGYGGGSWSGYDSATVRWVLRKTFIAPEDGVAVAQSVGFRGDGGARVRINGQDAGMYGQWNQAATSGTAQIPVTAGLNTVEIEVRDVGGTNNVIGRLDIALPKTVQFMRRQTVDCATGEVIATHDTTLDGEPYEVVGDVGQCEPVAECCEQAPPEQRVDVETELLCIRDAESGDVLGQVVVERVYDDQSGDRLEQRLTDPTTGEEVALPAGAELVLCQEPACPVAFSTECVGAVERTEASYDNTSLIGGVPGQCGSVQGPGGQFPCQPTTGALTITSWVVNGEETISEGGGRAFNGGPCGAGTAAAPGMHLNWSQALTNLDPTGAVWSVKSEPACAFFVGSTGGTQTVYGAMTVQDAAGQQWILGPAQACEETQYTKVYTQECDGSISVSWLDPQGVETDAPTGDLVPCGTGCGPGGGRGLDVETLPLCDIAADGTIVPFLRHLTYGSAGQVTVVVDTGLDGFAPYTAAGDVGVCQDGQTPGTDVELLPMCVIDNNSGGSLQRILAEVRYDTETGERLGVAYVDPETWGPVALPGGTHIGLCPEAEEQEPTPDAEVIQLCDLVDGEDAVPFLRHLVYTAGAAAPAVLDTALDAVTPYAPAGTVGVCQDDRPVTVLEECRWDDTDGDGIGDVEYVELIGVDADGTLTPIGTYVPDLSAPYTPVGPVADGPIEGAPAVQAVQAHRLEIPAGGSWSAGSVALLQSVTAVAHGGPAQITTADGVSPLYEGESVTWSVVGEGDAMVVGPLDIEATTGTVTVTYTRGVTA